MPLNPWELAAWRPYLYHLTARENLARVRTTRRLESAATLLEAGGCPERVRERRRGYLPVHVAGERVLIRDQDPLYPANIRFEGGWTFGDLVEHLNRHVFFWPGDERGPLAYGVRHFEWYRRERPVILRAATIAIWSVNKDRTPLFCAYNSGSPRCSNGKPSPRGPATFIPAHQFPLTSSRVVEVVFRDGVQLPPRVEVSEDWRGPWKLLWAHGL